MPFVQTPHATVHFTDTGGDLPPVVLSHGFFMDGEMFTPQVDEFAGEYRVVTVDARRHGRTEDDGTAFTYWDLADDLIAVLDHLGIDSAVIGGMSQGGYIALRVALVAPSRVTALLLLDTESAASMPEQKEMYRALFSGWCSDAPLEPLAGMLAPQLIGGSPEQQEPWLAKWSASDRPAIAPAAECLIERDAVTDRLPEIKAPALVVRGELDGSAVAERAEELVEGLPNSSPAVTIPGAGHAANWTHPEPVNAEIRKFLEDIVFG